MLEKGEKFSSTHNSLLLYLVVDALQGFIFLSFPQCFSLCSRLSPVPPVSATVPVCTGSQLIASTGCVPGPLQGPHLGARAAKNKAWTLHGRVVNHFSAMSLSPVPGSQAAPAIPAIPGHTGASQQCCSFTDPTGQ